MWPALTTTPGGQATTRRPAEEGAAPPTGPDPVVVTPPHSQWQKHKTLEAGAATEMGGTGDPQGPGNRSLNQGDAATWVTTSRTFTGW